MPATNLKRESNETDHSSARTLIKSNIKRKRKLSVSPEEEAQRLNRRKRQKRHLCKSFCTSKEAVYNVDPNDRLVLDEKLWNKVNPVTTGFSKRINNEYCRRSLNPELCSGPSIRRPPSICWIEDLPQEILLKIFSYLPLAMLLHTIPKVCKKWEVLALDWTLWKGVEDLTIKNMVISTAKLRTLLRTIPRLKKLELILRNDTEELLHELFETHQNLEVLKLDRCYRSTLQMNILSQTVTSILESCPKLKTVMLTDTYFHSKNFYRCLAKKFRTIERINVTCTTKSEMDVFMENLKENVPEVEFQRVPMMGRAEGKQIYWGPILGLVVRPIPTSPFHQQYIHDNYPNYAF